MASEQMKQLRASYGGKEPPWGRLTHLLYNHPADDVMYAIQGAQRELSDGIRYEPELYPVDNAIFWAQRWTQGWRQPHITGWLQAELIRVNSTGAWDDRLLLQMLFNLA